jgi:hypothetical protein
MSRIQCSRRARRAVVVVFVLCVLAGATAVRGEGRIPCTEAALLDAIDTANAAGGGTIRFDCRDEVIPMTGGLGVIWDHVVLDGEDRRISLEYVGPFEGCVTGDNGIGAPAIARMRGSESVIRGLWFRNFLESLQVEGPANRVEDSFFLGHPCSDDGISTIDVRAMDTVIHGNLLLDYEDKALQMSFGGGVIQKNIFVDTRQPIRGPYDNRAGGVFSILDNWFGTRGDRSRCDGVRLDGAYRVEFGRNTVRCWRGLRVGGTTEIAVHDNRIEGNGHVGVRVGGDAVAVLWNNIIQDNGFSSGSLPSGGVVVWENARVDLGGGELELDGQLFRSPGGNTLRRNGAGDLRNLRTDYVVPAEYNHWDGETFTEIEGDVEGLVDFDPFLTGSMR